MADIPLEELAKRLGGEEERAEAVHALLATGASSRLYTWNLGDGLVMDRPQPGPQRIEDTRCSPGEARRLII